MSDIAPEITRQRLLIEGYYLREIGHNEVKFYLIELAAHLELNSYDAPIIHTPGSAGKTENEGFDAFLPLIDSGISLYVWTKARFFATVLFTCKHFGNDAAVSFTKDYFQVTKIISKEF